MLTRIVESAYDCLWMAGVVTMTVIATWVLGT